MRSDQEAINCAKRCRSCGPWQASAQESGNTAEPAQADDTAKRPPSPPSKIHTGMVARTDSAERDHSASARSLLSASRAKATPAVPCQGREASLCGSSYGKSSLTSNLRWPDSERPITKIRQGRGVDKDEVYGGDASMEARGLARLVGKE
eukprot:5458772-Amphidinium_carterae.1